MEDNIRQLKKAYKEKKNEAVSSEKRQIRHDYIEMKKKLKSANKIIKKNNLLESTDEFWSKFDFPSLEDYKKDNSSIENDEILEEMNEKIKTNKKQYEEVMKKANETINQIDEKLLELEKKEKNEKI